MARSKQKKEESAPVVRLPTRRSKRKAEAEPESPADVEPPEEATTAATKPKAKALKKTKQEANKNVEEEKESVGLMEAELSQVSKNSSESEGKPQNVLKCLDLLQYGPKRDRYFYMKSVQDNLVQRTIKQLKASDYAGRFPRRITALAWHQRYPFILASASKFGDIVYVTGAPSEPSANPNAFLFFNTKAEIEGAGPGCSITAMKFHDVNPNILYRSSIDGKISCLDIERRTSSVYHNTNDYHRWFCSLDVNFPQSFLIAGDNKGLAYQYGIDDGKHIQTVRLHKDKIHHCEFSKKDPNILVTTSLGLTDGVKIWDVRFLKPEPKAVMPTPLHVLEHNAAMNCARFSPKDGSRLLTSDQKEEIRVYQGPLWKDYITIKHHHKQFQHITPIKADWHPINEYIVIGRYPKIRISEPNNREPRAVEFFDSYSGKLVDAVYPPLDEICSLNAFNPTGEYLATGMNSKLVLWRLNLDVDLNPANAALPNTKGGSKSTLSKATRNLLRGRSAREYSPVSDDEEEEDTTAKKKKARTKTANTTTTSTSTTSNSKTSASKKKK